MKIVFTFVAGVVAVSYVGVCRAAPMAPPPPMMPAAGGQPESMEVAHQYFDVSVGGVRDLVETYREDDPGVYRRLTPLVDDLEAMRTRAWVIGWSTFLLGAGLTAGGLASYKAPKVGETPNFTPLSVAVAGIPIMMLAYFVGYAFGPSRDDYLHFVNYHNHLNPESPIRWQVGCIPGQHGPSFAGGLSLDLF